MAGQCNIRGNNESQMKLKLKWMLKLMFVVMANFIPIIAYAQQVSADSLSQFERCYYSQCFGYNITEIKNERLYDCIDLWTGTQYKLAGNDVDGIDCSRFVMMLYNYV